jgi:outer membrane receptor protein involved in Fe transport
MIRIYTIIVCLLLTSTVFAAAQGTVKGRVIDKQSNEALQFVNIRVSQGEKLVKGAITDIKGAFSISGLDDGSYTLTVSFVGYRNAVRSFTLSGKNKHVSYTAIYLSEDQRVLKEVEVTGQRSQMKLEVDRKTFTVDQVLAAAGGSASELLENIPSVEVTTDGVISLRGNTSVEVWINGKASGLTSDNRGEILQQIPAESIEKIEVIDNPSAKYSPEGSAGIINIVLKRDRKAGYYGSLQAGVNNKGGWNTGGNINYSSGVLDAFANVGYRRRKGTGHNEAEQTYLAQQLYQNSVGTNKNSGGGLFVRGGLTWHLTKKDDLTLSGMTMQGKYKNNNTTDYHHGTVGAAQDTRQMTRLTTGDGDMSMYHGEMGYTHNFSEKHKLEANLSYDKWAGDHGNIYQDRDTVFGVSLAETYQLRPMFVNNRSWEAKIDYENQIGENLKFEAGYNGRYSKENTPQESWTANNWDGTGLVLDEAYYNRFIYKIDTHALYATLSTKVGKLGVMAGLRGEYWKVDTESYTWKQENDATLRDEPFKKDYFQLFPSLFLNYPLTQTSQLQLNYTRRLRRPWGGQLNSFKNTRDASQVEFGNPLLTPEYTNSFSLNYLKTWPQHTLSIGTYYRPTTDVIQRIRYNVGGMVYSTNENVAKSQSAGVEVIGKNKLFGILDLTTTVNAYYYKLDGFSYTINGQVVTGASDENFSWDARMLAALILPYDISVQATGNYRSRTVITQGYRKPNASLDLGMRKTFLNRVLAVSVNWRDVFNTQKWDTYTETDSFTRHQKNWRDPRANISVAWNFGNMKKKKSDRRDDAQGDDDQQGFGGYEQ